MNNVSMKVKDGVLVITVDLAKRLGLSASGKNEIVATTGGNVTVPGTDIKLGLNAYTAPAVKAAS